MHIIVRTVSDYPNRFQKKIDELVNELCNENGYRITTISNLVQSDLGVVTSLSNYGKKSVSEKSYALSQTFVFEKE